MSHVFRSFSILRQSNLRLINKVKEMIIRRVGADPAEVLKGRNLEEEREFQYPTEIREVQQRDPISIEEEQEVIMETEKIVSNLERERMKELDKIYGTNTYFHPINEVYEERLDSEHSMERRRSKLQHLNRTLEATRFFQFDPQEKMDPVKIRNKEDFYKKLKVLMTAPVHEKQPTLITNKFESIIDNYAYLEGKDTAESTQTEKMNSHEYVKVLQFASRENILSEMSFFLNSTLEDNLVRDYYKSFGADNKAPIFYDDLLYYQKDITNEGLNLYRLKIDNKTSNSIVVKLLAENLANEVNVLNRKEMIDFLLEFANNETSPLKKVAFDMSVSLKYNENRFDVYDINFNENHQMMAITFEINNPAEEQLNNFVTLIKNIETQKFLHFIPNHSQGDIVFDTLGGLYYVKKNDTGRAGFLHRLDINGSDIKTSEKVIIEEGDPLFQLEVRKTLSNDYLLLESISVSGLPTNEIYIRPLNDPFQQFHLLLPRSEGIEYQVKHSNEYLILLIKDHVEGTQTVKKIRIITEKSSKNLLETGKKIGDQIMQLSASGLTLKSSMDKSDIKTSENEEQKQPTKALVVARLHTIETKPTTEIYGILEDMPILEANERIQYYIAFENYVVFHIKNSDKQYIKVYNHRSDKFHILRLSEEGAQIFPETNNRYKSPYYHFQLQTPNAPQRIISYNMGLRELQVIHTEHLIGFKPEDYSVEEVNIKARDGADIPVTFVYNNKRMDSESTVILHTECDLDSRAHMNFKPELRGLLDKGFIYAYPHIRGSSDFDADWFDQGSGLKRLTSVTDVIDTAGYLLENEVTPNVCLYGKGNLGGLISAVAFIKEPDLFTATVIEDPLIDLIAHLRESKGKDDIKCFGDINDKDVYEHIKQYSPYHADISADVRNLFVISNADSPTGYHSKKFVARVREHLNDNRNIHQIYYREFAPDSQEILKISVWHAFIINSIFKKESVI